MKSPFVPSSVRQPVSRRRLLQGALAGTLAQIAYPVLAQSPASRPLKLIVPFAAGGPTDLMARTIASIMSERSPRQVIVENKPGAGGNIAAVAFAAAPADGTSLLVAGQAIMAINKALYGTISYDPEGFAWVGALGSLPNVLVTNPNTVPARNVAEFVALARSKPDGLSYGSNGIGSLAHLSTEVFASAASVKFLHVPYQGVAPQISDLLSGRIDFSLIGASSAAPLVSGGRLNALALTSAARMASLPGIPSFVEAGYPMMDIPVWFAIFAQPGVPAPVLQELRAAVTAATANPTYIGEIEKQFGQVNPLTPEQAQQMLSRERKVWTETVARTGAKAN